MCVCVCVCRGFYNLHLPKYSKFFQSVYYIYYLSHAARFAPLFSSSSPSSSPASASPPASAPPLSIVLGFSYVCFAVLAAPSVGHPLLIFPFLSRPFLPLAFAPHFILAPLSWQRQVYLHILTFMRQKYYRLRCQQTISDPLPLRTPPKTLIKLEKSASKKKKK